MVRVITTWSGSARTWRHRAITPDDRYTLRRRSGAGRAGENPPVVRRMGQETPRRSRRDWPEPRGNPKHVGVMGYSLGAMLALSLGARFPDQVAAVVDYYGPVPPSVKEKAATFPPTLIIHGGKDRLVLADEAQQLDKTLTDANRPHQLKIIPSQGTHLILTTRTLTTATTRRTCGGYARLSWAISEGQAGRTVDRFAIGAANG